MGQPGRVQACLDKEVCRSTEVSYSSSRQLCSAQLLSGASLAAFQQQMNESVTTHDAASPFVCILSFEQAIFDSFPGAVASAVQSK